MEKSSKSRTTALLQMVIFSAIGIVMFFVPFDIGGKSTIAFDHLATYLVKQQREVAVGLLVLLMLYGVIKPFVTGDWRKSLTAIILSILKIIGCALGLAYIAGVAPEAVMAKDMLPFLFDKLALPVGMIVPIGALILAFLIGFGLLEMMGVIMQPVMRPIFKTPGASAIDAVASFVGSYSVGLLITNRVYLQGGYTAKEAAIIATGFSTVSTAFMVIVAKTLDMMEYWSLYFWSCLVITFVVTAITVRLPPLAQMNDTRREPELPPPTEGRLKAALETGIRTAQNADSVPRILWSNFRDGIEMAAAIVPSILAIGLIGLLLAKHTPVFDWLGFALYPFTLLGGLPEPMTAAKGISSGLAEMFLPALLLAKADVMTRYVTAVVSVSSIIFFSAMIPCVLSTKIPLSVPKMILVWFIRAALSIVLAGLFAQFAMSVGWMA